MEISGRTKICGVIGNPIKHTLSPIMHNAAFKKLNLDFAYVAFKVEENMLQEAIEGMRALRIHGLNVTIPHKESIIQLLDGIDPEARDIGAVNTILNKADELIGYNTDGIGAIKAIEGHKINPRKKRIVMLGAGGSARSIAYHISQVAEKVVVLNRTEERAKKLAENLKFKINANIVWDQLSKEVIRKQLIDADILINTTSIGLSPRSDESLVDPKFLNPELCVFDIVYNLIGTKLIRDARKIGAKTIDGIDMLIYQGAMAFTIWTGVEAPIKAMKDAIIQEIS
ncbi:MAG: shikimate dehydrogenase [Candidatus Bathyarchaeota archaeon]|nr:shikimate dehydrogenase [Candidatus Bathyarchaeota archaeon]